MFLLSTIIGLLCYVGMVLGIHTGLHRSMVRRGKELTAQQSSFISAQMTTLIMSVVMIAMLQSFTLPDSIYWVIVFGVTGNIYFLFICVTESGRRYYLVKLLMQYQRLTKEDFIRLYGHDYIIQMRLERIIAWGIVDENNEVITVRKGGLYWITRCIYWWSKLLGFSWISK